MKKLFYLLAAVAVVAFVGCSKDDDKTPNIENIVGTWEVYKEYYEYVWDSGSDKGWDYEWGEEERSIYKFNADKTFEDIYMWKSGGQWKQDIESGTYSINGKSLILLYKDFEDDDDWEWTLSIKSLSSNELVLSDYSEWDDGERDLEEYYLKRIE